MAAVRPKPKPIELESEEAALVAATPPERELEQRVADLERAVADLRSELHQSSAQMRTLLTLVAVFRVLSRQ